VNRTLLRTSQLIFWCVVFFLVNSRPSEEKIKPFSLDSL
jgi:hypothetical protein